ncbi:Stp1/IreP family PP2C-type Ser/Thr phosphatase [Lactimicrobium massiliense]|uniref:Stp1/IreP family PP2C-type Ser/Thr phosphatase n=1 Tax=Lactimicrobium massiliense TaxID=2161814 RepID=UPI000D55B465|nr:Stp1/IreP family PP2C-type Ser/Thr phosphatase [Lactimicrobium massiliense]
MKYYGMTDRGKMRKTNQDSYVIACNEAGDVFALVCDGIGGNLGGDVASRMAVSWFSVAFSENKGFASEEDARAFIANGIRIVNKQIYDLGQARQDLHGMGTTLCGAMLTRVGRFIVNVGDSRAYGFKNNGEFRQLTMDHTLVNDMIMHGELTKEQARTFPRKNVLTNAVGVWDSVRSDIDVHHEDLNGILLCSDGLHSYVDEKKIRSIVLDKEFDPALRSRKLVKASLDAGGFDNVTVILIDLEEGDMI